MFPTPFSKEAFNPVIPVSPPPAQSPCPSGFLTHSRCGLSHCVSHTGVHSHVLGYQRAHLHVDCAGGRVLGQGDPALELLCIACGTVFEVSSSH